MKIYNTLTRQKEEFVPVHPGKVGMYVCGPTVYNYIHIGNARPMIIFDTVRRYFEYKGYEVNYVSNFTDVDDKIIKKANEEGVTATEIAERYIKECKQDMEALNIKPATHQPRATEEIGGMIKMIQTLIEKGHAYEVDGTVYFKTRSFKDYGKLSKKNIDDLEAGHREIKVTGEEGKKDPLDFVLWKPKKEGEIAWDSPWGEGRPGWHTECVVMINNNLGNKIDIHGGGMDLRFPHHENEVAQQEACHGNALANYWVHNAMVNINGDKMSKSLGNVLRAKDVVEKLGTNLTRWLISSVHYRKELNFSDETIETAEKELEKVLQPLHQADLKAVLKDVDFGEAYDESAYQAFLEAMEDDMNTPNAYTVIFDTVKKLNGELRQREIQFETVGKLRNAVEKMLDILGICVEKVQLTEEEKSLYLQWEEAKKEKDFEKADALRSQLIERGIL